MPRTKVKQANNLNAKKDKKNTVHIKEENPNQTRKNVATMLLSSLDQEFKIKSLEIQNKMICTLEAINNISFEEFTACIETSKAHKTIDEIQNEKSFAVNATGFSERSILKNMTFKSINATSNNLADNTLANTGQKNKFTDEGYLTAGDSGRSASSDRASVRSGCRSTVRQTVKKTRRSRSLSKNVTINAPYKKTPKNRLIPPNSFGLVTPKMKPNTPLSVLRRPKLGEMAISMQGSPLLVSGVVTETCANVNIPLEDGRILSLQPSRSLRMSEIPNLDEHTRQQLLALRDNLNKVVKMGGDF